MYYYIFLLFMIAGAFFITRLNTCYHSSLFFKTYIEVKNPVLCLLISKTSPQTYKSGILTEHQNRLLHLGAIFYIFWFLLIIFTLVMFLVIPDIPTPPFTLNDYFGEYCIFTLNQVLPAKLWISYSLFDVSFLVLNITNCNEDINKNKVVRTMWVLVVIFMFAVSMASLAYVFIH